MSIMVQPKALLIREMQTEALTMGGAARGFGWWGRAHCLDGGEGAAQILVGGEGLVGWDDQVLGSVTLYSDGKAPVLDICIRHPK